MAGNQNGLLTIALLGGGAYLLWRQMNLAPAASATALPADTAASGVLPPINITVTPPAATASASVATPTGPSSVPVVQVPPPIVPATDPAASIIAADYQLYLHRAADAAGAAYWQGVYDNQVAGGVDPATAAASVAAAFANSAEAKAGA